MMDILDNWAESLSGTDIFLFIFKFLAVIMVLGIIWIVFVKAVMGRK
jgi:hypothetical protein